MRAARAEDVEGLIREGVQLRKRGEDAKAHGYFQRAHDIAHTARTAAQLGLSDLALGKWLEAELLLDEALDATDPWVDGHKSAIEQSRATAREKLGKLQIDGAPPEARIEATGRPVTKLPADGAIFVSPGPVHVRVEAQGFQSTTKDTTVAMGATAHVRLAMKPVEPDVKAVVVKPGDESAIAQQTPKEAKPADVVPPAARTHEDGAGEDQGLHRQLRITGIAVGAVGVAAVVTGFILRGMAGKKADAITSDGMAGRPYNPSNGNYQTLDKAGTGLLVGGAVAVGAGVVCYLVNRDSANSEGTAVSFLAGSDRFGLVLAGHY
jgi:hypothetical protein